MPELHLHGPHQGFTSTYTDLPSDPYLNTNPLTRQAARSSYQIYTFQTYSQCEQSSTITPNNSSNKPKNKSWSRTIRDLLFSSSVELSGDRDICDMKVTRKLTWEIYGITYNFKPEV